MSPKLNRPRYRGTVTYPQADLYAFCSTRAKAVVLPTHSQLVKGQLVEKEVFDDEQPAHSG